MKQNDQLENATYANKFSITRIQLNVNMFWKHAKLIKSRHEGHRVSNHENQAFLSSLIKKKHDKILLQSNVIKTDKSKQLKKNPIYQNKKKIKQTKSGSLHSDFSLSFSLPAFPLSLSQFKMPSSFEISLSFIRHFINYNYTNPT